MQTNTPCDQCLYGEVPHHDECVAVILATIDAIEIYTAHAFDRRVREALERLRRADPR